MPTWICMMAGMGSEWVGWQVEVYNTRCTRKVTSCMYSYIGLCLSSSLFQVYTLSSEDDISLASLARKHNGLIALIIRRSPRLPSAYRPKLSSPSSSLSASLPSSTSRLLHSARLLGLTTQIPAVSPSSPIPLPCPGPSSAPTPADPHDPPGSPGSPSCTPISLITLPTAPLLFVNTVMPLVAPTRRVRSVCADGKREEGRIWAPRFGFPVLCVFGLRLGFGVGSDSGPGCGSGSGCG
jgi:hypothetical protein